MSVDHVETLRRQQERESRNPPDVLRRGHAEWEHLDAKLLESIMAFVQSKPNATPNEKRSRSASLATETSRCSLRAESHDERQHVGS